LFRQDRRAVQISNVVLLLCFNRNGVRPSSRNEQQKEVNRVV
jgi:hypothetical protein